MNVSYSCEKMLVHLGMVGALCVLVIMCSACKPTPSAPDWNRKDAWRLCEETLNSQAFPDCASMHMCANEAPLDESNYRVLLEIMRERGCEAP